MAGQIRIHRERAYRDKLRGYRVVIDGQKVGKVRNDANAVFDVAPGEHKIQLRIDYLRSEVITVQVPEGGFCNLTTRPGSPAAMLFGLLGAVLTGFRYPDFRLTFTSREQ